MVDHCVTVDLRCGRSLVPQISSAFLEAVWMCAHQIEAVLEMKTEKINNEEQIIIGYPIDGAMGCSGGGRVRKFLGVCL